MSMTRRDILVGAGGVIAASAVDAVSSESPIMAKMQSTHADGPTGDGRKETTTRSYSGARAFNGIYHGDYLNQIAFPHGWYRRWHDLPGRDRRAFKILVA